MLVTRFSTARSVITRCPAIARFERPSAIRPRTSDLLSSSSYAGFVADQVADNDTVRSDVEQITAAAERAARLTRQLLQFAKRGTAEPEILDLNTRTHRRSHTAPGEIVLLALAPGQVLRLSPPPRRQAPP